MAQLIAKNFGTQNWNANLFDHELMGQGDLANQPNAIARKKQLRIIQTWVDAAARWVSILISSLI